MDDLKAFTESFQVGESLIITDTLGGTAGAGASYYDLVGNVTARGQLANSKIVLNRLHIYRANKNTIHIYRDYGNINSLVLSLDLESYIPIARFFFTIDNGRAKTLYHRLNITSEPAKNPFLADHLRNLKNILLTGSLEMFQTDPIILEHHFHQKLSNLRLFSYRRTKLNSRDRITITHPSGEKAEFLRGSQGKRNGQHWQALGLDVANWAIEEFLAKDIIVNMAGNNNPGDSFKGRSRYRLINFDSLIEDQSLKENFMHINHRWKGWELSAKQAKKIVTKINSRFDYEFFDPRVLANTQRILLYIIDLNIFIYESAIQNLLNLPREQAAQLFSLYSRLENRRDFRNRIIRHFNLNRKRCRAKRSGERLEKALRPCIKMVSMVEQYIRSVPGLIAFFGGKENFRIEAQILGYREGDESAYRPIASHTLGEVGAEKPLGPLLQVQLHPDFNLTQGEFFIYWLMSKL